MAHMFKKRYFILTSSDREDEILSKAANYYGSKEYEIVTETPEFMEIIKNVVKDSNQSFNISLMIIGVTTVAMSLCDSVYVAKDWEQDDHCKFCHALAFSHGLDMVYES